MKYSRALALSLLALTASHAVAGVTSYASSYIESRVQTSDAPPTGDSFAYLYSFIFCDTDFDVTSATLTSPNYLESFIQSSERFSVLYSGISNNLATVLANYPAGTYTFAVDAGNLAPASATLTIPTADFTNEDPYLVNGTYSAIQNHPEANDAYLEWLPTTNSGLNGAPITIFDLINLTGVTNDLNQSGDGALFSSITIPEATLQSGRTYRYVINFNTQTDTLNAGFGSATGSVSFQKTVSGDFHVLANPGTIAGKLIIEGRNSVLLSPITIEVIGDGGVEDSQIIPLGYENWYAMDTLVTGVKGIRFSADRCLSKIVPLVDLGVGQDDITLTLLNGDVDRDNEVGPGDFGLLASAFLSVPGDPNWNADADLDTDFEVGPGDFAIIANNFLESGD